MTTLPSALSDPRLPVIANCALIAFERTVYADYNEKGQQRQLLNARHFLSWLNENGYDITKCPATLYNLKQSDSVEALRALFADML